MLSANIPSIPSKARQVLREALALPPRARADIAGTLLRSLDVPEESGVEAAWAVEIERRLREVQTGEAKLIHWKRVRRRLEAAVSRGRKKRLVLPRGASTITEGSMRKKIESPIHPGEVLHADFLEPMGVSQHRLARGVRVPPRRISDIVHGKRDITADTALRLARFFGMSQRFWLNLQDRYDLEVQRDARRS